MIGTGALFDRDAEKRFKTMTAQRYGSIQVRMLKKGIPQTFTLPKFRAHILAKLGGCADGAVRCRYCGAVCDLADVALDHAEPLIRGGSPGLDNLELICQPCNDAKGGLFPAEYEALLAFLEREIPLARTEVLKRLRQSVKLAAGMRHNMGRISALKKSGAWQQAGKKRKAVAVEEEF